MVTPLLRKSQSPGLRLLVTVAHLTLNAYLGVAARGFLGKLFTLGCNNGGNLCFEGGSYFKDLPSNMLGCFVIGLFAASTTVGLDTDKPLALLPAGHSWQRNLELHIGIRTGFCGCLTTFASWQLELVTLAVGESKWVAAIWGYLIGMCSALVSYRVGTHCALAIDNWSSHRAGGRYSEQGSRGQVLQGLGRRRQAEFQYVAGERDDLGYGPVQQVLLQAEPDLPRVVPTDLSEVRSRRLSSQAATGAATAAEAGSHNDGSGGSKPEGSGSSGDGGKGDKAPPQKRLSAMELQRSLRGSYKTDGCALLAVLALSAALGAGVALESRHLWLRTIWASCLLGPLGCLLRWRLSKLNYGAWLGRWAWLPAGTLLANMAGCAVDFGLQALLVRSAALSYWGSLWVNATIAGFCGSLTTVSTFITEVDKMADAVPDNLRAYSYTAISLLGGALLGVAIYGWSVWAG